MVEKLRRGKNGQGAERELTGADIAAIAVTVHKSRLCASIREH
jgi:hypothetical protein